MSTYNKAFVIAEIGCNHMGQMEIASEIGISQAQVSRLEKGALEQIRKQM